jgi:hypothetical protein
MAQSTDLFVGDWKVEIKDTPYGTIKFELILERVAGKLTGRIVDERSPIETKMNYITENGNSLKLNFPFSDIGDLDLTLETHNDELYGSMMDTWEVKGTRVKK